MRIAIMGSGGVGGYFGGRLAAAGEDVTFIARGAHLDAIRAHGLVLESTLGDVTVTPAQASDDPAAVGPVDLVIFTVKLYDTEAAAEATRPLLGPATGVVTFQNGVDSTEVLGRLLGIEHVIGGVAQIGAVVARPGVIRHSSPFARFLFGELDGAPSTRVEALAQACTAAGIDHEVSTDISLAIWRKMIFLAPMSGMTALLRQPIGPIRADPDTRAMLERCIDEAVQVAIAARVQVTDSAVEETMGWVDALAPGMRSSMLEDLEQGRRLELPWLSGALVRLGRTLGVPTPTHAFITTALKPHLAGRPA